MNWSSTVTPSDTVPPAVIVLAGWVVITSLFSVAGTIVGEVRSEERRVGKEGRLGGMVYGEQGEELICSPLKLATPLAATTEVVPAAKLCEARARMLV